MFKFESHGFTRPKRGQLKYLMADSRFVSAQDLRWKR